jgi:hypothetical protein
VTQKARPSRAWTGHPPEFERVGWATRRYRDAFQFDAIVALREELRNTVAKLDEIAKQKKALGLGL